MPKHVVRWNLEEQQQVAQQAAKIRLEQQLGELDAWRQAQQVLPTHRRRKIITISLIAPATRALYKQQLQELQRRPKDVPKPEVPQQSAVPPVPSEESTTPVVDDLLEALADAVAIKFAEAFRRSMQRQLREIAPAIAEQLQLEPPQSRQSKRSLLVVGLLPAQAETMRKRFGDRLDLRFVSSQETPQVISSRIGNSDKVILMTNFINHSHQNAAMQAAGRDNVLLVTGGISSLTKQLDRL